MLKKLFNLIFNIKGSLRGEMISVTDYNDIAPIAINGAVTVYTKAVHARYFDNLGLFLLCSGASPNITINVQQSPQKPAEANKNRADTYFVTPSGIVAVCTAFSSITVPLIQPLSLVPMLMYRFQIVGNGGNGSDTKVDLRLFEQELIS